jgi:hypothetical protein
MAFLEFVGILFLTQVAGYGSGFMTVKINNLLVIAFGKLWNSGHAKKRYIVSGAIVAASYILTVFVIFDFTSVIGLGLEILGLAVLTAIFIIFYIVGIYHADKRFSEAGPIMEKIVEVTYATGYSLDEEKIRIDTIKNINTTMQAMPESYRVALDLLFFFFDSRFMVFLIGLLSRSFWHHRFVELEFHQQKDYFDAWEKNRFLHYAVQALKSLIAFGYYTSPGTWKDVGYGGTLLGRSYWK